MDARCLSDAFVEATENCRSLFGFSALQSYQGFMRALVTWSPTMVPTLMAVVRERRAISICAAGADDRLGSPGLLVPSLPAPDPGSWNQSSAPCGERHSR